MKPILRTFVVAAALLALPGLALAALSVPNFHGLQIPDGGVSRGAAPGGGGRIVIYTYQMDVSALNTKTRSVLAASGWKIASDQRSPRGTIRLSVSKGGATVRISITRNGPNSALILSR